MHRVSVGFMLKRQISSIPTAAMTLASLPTTSYRDSVYTIAQCSVSIWLLPWLVLPLWAWFITQWIARALVRLSKGHLILSEDVRPSCPMKPGASIVPSECPPFHPDWIQDPIPWKVWGASISESACCPGSISLWISRSLWCIWSLGTTKQIDLIHTPPL